MCIRSLRSLQERKVLFILGWQKLGIRTVLQYEASVKWTIHIARGTKRREITTATLLRQRRGGGSSSSIEKKMISRTARHAWDHIFVVDNLSFIGPRPHLHDWPVVCFFRLCRVRRRRRRDRSLDFRRAMPHGECQCRIKVHLRMRPSSKPSAALHFDETKAMVRIDVQKKQSNVGGPPRSYTDQIVFSLDSVIQVHLLP